ncbi:MAG: permease-like cell division protein FtsX [Oscillospiraceae bacterium]|nr:permease-like cell division protein FtsX [Oscillospiraceae bacterium]
MRVNSFAYLFKSGFKNLWHNRLMSAASIGVLVACMILIGGAALLSLNVRNIVGIAGEENEVVVFLEEGLDQDEIDQIGIDIQKLGNIEDVTYVSKEDALKTEQEKEKWGGLLDGLSEEDNPLPASYRIHLVDITENKLIRTCEKIAQIEGIEDYNAPYKEATILTDIQNAVTVVGAIVVVILVAVSIMIIANTIKITVFSRSKEIYIMKLVGATDTFIRLPFMIEGILIGLIAAGLAFGILWLGYNYALDSFQFNGSSWLSITADSLVAFEDVAVYLFGLFAGLGGGLGWLGSIVFVRKHLRV